MRTYVVCVFRLSNTDGQNKHVFSLRSPLFLLPCFFAWLGFVSEAHACLALSSDVPGVCCWYATTLLSPTGISDIVGKGSSSKSFTLWVRVTGVVFDRTFSRTIRTSRCRIRCQAKTVVLHVGYAYPRVVDYVCHVSCAMVHS